MKRGRETKRERQEGRKREREGERNVVICVLRNM
jgi:hypothetical protein